MKSPYLWSIWQANILISWKNTCKLLAHIYICIICRQVLLATRKFPDLNGWISVLILAMQLPQHSSPASSGSSINQPLQFKGQSILNHLEQHWWALFPGEESKFGAGTHHLLQNIYLVCIKCLILIYFSMFSVSTLSLLKLLQLTRETGSVFLSSAFSNMKILIWVMKMRERILKMF